LALRYVLSSLLALLLLAQSGFSQSSDDVFGVISKFSGDLYTLGEWNGGSEAEWTQLEQSSADKLKLALAGMDQDADLLNAKGRTPLHQASALGFGHLVEVMLQDDRLLALLDTQDQDGLTAFEHALLAMKENLLACHPRAENPFVLVPYYVTLPYYEVRQPYTKVQALLQSAGAKAGSETAKEVWAARCTQDDEDARAQVSDAVNLYATLKEISQNERDAALLAELEKQADLYRELIQTLSGASRPSAEEVKLFIDQLYRDKGFEPPDE